MHVMSYSADMLKERAVTEEEFAQIHLWYFPIPVRNEGDRSVTWLHIHDKLRPEMMEQLGMLFGLHPMLLEDIMSNDERPKAENYGNFFFVVLKEIGFDEAKEDIYTSQISFVLGPDFLLSFQESTGFGFQGMAERIRTGKARLRKLGADYLMYALIDHVVDNYFYALEKIHHNLNELEEVILSSPTRQTLEKIHLLKREIISLRSIMMPSIEVIRILQKGDTHLIEDPNLIYFRNVHEQITQAMDMFITFQDLLSDMVDTYVSGINHKMNDVMKLLTILTTIFIPLTFISSLYGMNFDYMPELHWKWGYGMVLTLMVTLAGGMLYYFKKKKWF
ncbi:MAG: magnesium/cobalt transporter CorA [SAR324 cluster bacterium]|nr:magnesium/cobalt transporter CorA [SAR324 cluster bacterium]